ncbi:uncharacterized protein PRCAT00004513001 [Priceomyces carsonii]|uniref:uncharacterized protein n=1 Tax=Priceomyces carsonii TaxID=28549 RepID=UPI002ED7888D|nr:unnamed protein product [Priceomyces carsonii]
MSKKVFITGASSFVGQSVTDNLLKTGYKVKIILRKPAQVGLFKSHYSDIGLINNLEIVKSAESFEDPSTFTPHLHDVDYVMHLATPTPRNSESYLADMIKPAVNITTSILKASKEHKNIKRVVSTSSYATLFDRPRSDKPLNELSWSKAELTDQFKFRKSDPYSPYVVSKTLAEKALWRYVESESPSFDFITLLPTYIFGPTVLQRKGDPLSGSNQFIWSLLKYGQKSSMHAQAVHVLDVAEAHAKALDPNIKGNQRFLLDSGRKFEYNEAIDVAKTDFPDKEWKFGNFKSIHSIKLDNSKAKNILGMSFRPYKEMVYDLIKQQVDLSH